MTTKVTLIQARSPEHPDGDIEDRLVLNLCLTGQGLIDLHAYEDASRPWLASRAHGDAPPQDLEVIRIDEGWALQSTDNLDDPIWVFDGIVYRPGELISLRRPDGEELLFRIVATESV